MTVELTGAKTKTDTTNNKRPGERGTGRTRQTPCVKEMRTTKMRMYNVLMQGDFFGCTQTSLLGQGQAKGALTTVQNE